MARSQAKPSTENLWPQAKEKRPQEFLRRSVRSAKAQEQSTLEGKGSELRYLSSSTSINTQHNPISPKSEAVQQAYPPQELEANRNFEHKRKRLQEGESFQGLSEKCLRIASSGCVVDDKAAVENITKDHHSIDHWIQEWSWPKKYFDHNKQVWEDIEEVQQQEEWDKQRAEKGNKMAHPLLARKWSSTSLAQKASEFGVDTSCDLPREAKSATYTSEAYETELANKGSFMRESDLDTTDESKTLCQVLLDSAQTVIQDSIFRDDRFKTACLKIRNQNEARVLQDITRLIVPSAESLATCGATCLEHLVESVNKGWNSAICVTNPRPQPDYSVAFGQSAFTNEQLKKLKPFVGQHLYRPYRFFLLHGHLENVKCGATALDIADRQNAHSMTHAVRAVVELYKYAKWENEFYWKGEVHRKILAFSISHDDKNVRIYGHYPVIEDDTTTYYRYPIRDFFLTDLNGKEKWTAYKFTKNLYELWMPKHLEWICKAIDVLPDDLGSEVPTSLSMSNASGENEIEPNSQEMTESETSSQATGRSKRPRLRPTAMLQQEIDWLKQQLAQEREESKQQLAQKREESKQRHAELMEQMEEQKARNKELMEMLKQRLTKAFCKPLR